MTARGATGEAARLLAASTIIAGLLGVPALADEAPPPTPPVATAPPAAPVGTPATVIDNKSLESILGRKVESPSGEDMGSIVDLLVDRTGQPRAAVIDFGGFFGVGTRKIAVDWRAIHFNMPGKPKTIVVDLPRALLRTAPVYKDDEPVVVLGRPDDAKPAEPSTPAPDASKTPDAAPK